MSEPAFSVAFFDPEHGLHGSARSAATLLFEGSSTTVLPDGPQVAEQGGGWHAALDGAFDLELEPVAEPAILGGVHVHVCSVRGTVGEQDVRCLGTVAQTHVAPVWEELDALRSLSAVFDAEHALLAIAHRPRGAVGHGVEQTAAWLLEAGKPRSVDEARISTVYDGDGRQRSAGLELWLPGDEFPHRASGTLVAGSSLSLEGIDVHAAVFRWRMGDREGAGSYELWARSEQVAA